MRLGILIVVALLAGSASAQEIQRLTGKVLDEADQERTLISKPGWLRGVHVVGQALPTEQRPQILTLLPESWLGHTVCARITNLRGNYYATVEFQIPEEMEDRRRILDFATENRDVIASISPENSGVALEKGECVGDVTTTGRQFITNFWNESAQTAVDVDAQEQLLLNMNISRADELIATAKLVTTNDQNASETFPLPVPECSKINDPDALAFNHRCSIMIPTAKLVGQQNASITFAFSRLYRGRESSQRQAEILIGANQ